MFKNFLYRSAVAATVALSLAACSDDDKPKETEDPKGEMEQLTPTESKKFLETTANEFLGKFRAADQRDLIVLASYFDEEYADLEAPEEFDIDEEESVNPAVTYIRELARAIKSADASRAGAAAIKYTYTLDPAKFKGVYEPGVSRWIRKADSKDIIFRFTDAAGKQCELKAEMSDKTSDGEVSVFDEYYDYETGTYVENGEEYVYKFRIPKDVTVTLTCGGSELASAKVNSDLSVSGHKVSVTANVKAANLDAAVKLDGTDNQVAMNSSLVVSGETVVTARATVNGNHLCDFEFYRDMEGDEDDLIALFKDGSAAVSVLDKVRVDANVTFNRSVFKAIDDEFDNYEFNTQASAETAVKNAVATLNSSIKAEVRYNNKETVQATLFWKYDFEEWGEYWEYTIEPLMQFEADKTTYSFEEYFENGFASVEDQWDALLESYEKVWDSAQK